MRRVITIVTLLLSLRIAFGGAAGGGAGRQRSDANDVDARQLVRAVLQRARRGVEGTLPGYRLHI